MTLLAFVIFGGIALASYKFTKSQIGESAAISTKLSISSSEKLVGLIEMYREYYLRNSTNTAIERFESERIELAYHVGKLNFFPSVPKYFLETSIFVIVLILGAFQFTRLDASNAVSTLAIFLAAASRIAPASLRIQQSITGIKNNIDMSSPALELNEYLLSQNNGTLVSETAHVVDLIPGTAFDLKVKIEDFAFDTSSTFRLSNIEFDVPFGSSLAIVGQTGSGKTTLVDLILGFLPQQNSDITLANCQPSRLIQLNPGIVSYVPQDITVLNGTLAENVTLSKDLIQEDLWGSLAMAQFDDFVRTLPDAENTVIGDNGIKLSGGQRQRLGLARALYTKPKLLILDEATSALDAMTEANISESLIGLHGKISIVLIAHRLSTVRSAEKILYLENGRALAEGSFDEVREKVPDFDRQAKLLGL
jgi:ABC-type bacteriocin/lantibiotic exporter with double-glycine peptidase domain